MNRRQVLRNGALAITSLTAASSKLSLAHQTPTSTQQTTSQEDDAPRFGSRTETIFPVATSLPSKRDDRSKLADFTTLSEPALASLASSEKVIIYTRESSTLSFEGQSGALSTSELKDQYIVFQFTLANGQPALIESSQVEPTIQTSAENPDIALNVNLESFHIADSEGVDPETKASVRLTVGEEDSSSGVGDPLFWAVSTGINLYDAQKKHKSIPADLKSNFMKTLNNRPIALQGAIGSMRFEIIKHKKPSWWERIFEFANSDPGKLLISTLGFPAIVEQAVSFIDEAASRFQNTNAQILMASHKLLFAFSQQARTSYVAGGPVKIGVLNPGRWILVRGRDFEALKDAKAWFFPTYGILVPSGVSGDQVVAGKYADPFANITYAILNSKATPTKINLFNG